jgi:hypothetical protein
MAHTLRLFIAAAGVAAATLASHTALAAGPAVSDTNFKISGFGGALNAGDGASGLGGIAGSLTLPASTNFGLQFDGAVATTSGDTFWNAGAHLFWRDPSIGLFGLYTGYAHQGTLGGLQVRRIGVEAESYFANATLRGAVGQETGDVTSDIYANAKLDLYVTPNAMLTAGYTFEGTSFANAGAEVQLGSAAGAGVSLFADGNVHDASTYQVLGGLKIAFGQTMSLKDRHRRQDPSTYLMMDMLAATQASSAKAAAVPVPECALLATDYPTGSCTCPAGSIETPFGDGTAFFCDVPAAP